MHVRHIGRAFPAKAQTCHRGWTKTIVIKHQHQISMELQAASTLSSLGNTSEKLNYIGRSDRLVKQRSSTHDSRGTPEEQRKTVQPTEKYTLLLLARYCLSKSCKISTEKEFQKHNRQTQKMDKQIFRVQKTIKSGCSNVANYLMYRINSQVPHSRNFVSQDTSLTVEKLQSQLKKNVNRLLKPAFLYSL